MGGEEYKVYLTHLSVGCLNKGTACTLKGVGGGEKTNKITRWGEPGKRGKTGWGSYNEEVSGENLANVFCNNSREKKKKLGHIKNQRSWKYIWIWEMKKKKQQIERRKNGWTV